MKNTLSYPEEAIEKFYTYIDRAIVIKIGYLLLIFILQGLKIYKAPDIVFIAVALMALTSLTIGIWFEKFSVKIKTIINALFVSTLFDLFLLTILIYYLGGIEFIYYTFYIILSFIIFPRFQAIAITAWTVFLFLSLVGLRYFQIIPISLSVFTKEEQIFSFFPYFSTTIITLILTFSFLGYFSYGFYKMMARRIILLKQAQGSLEEEKASLEIRVQARKRDIEAERKSLEIRVQEREKEIEEERLELEKRAKELERFQKAAGGREIKMSDLEKEKEKLEKRLRNGKKKL